MTCWARTWPVCDEPPSTRAALAPSWAAAIAMWEAWYQSANCTIAVINSKSSGMTSTVCNVPEPLWSRRAARLIALVPSRDVVGLARHLDGDDGHHCDGKRGKPRCNQDRLNGGTPSLVLARIGEPRPKEGEGESDDLKFRHQDLSSRCIEGFAS